MYMMKSLIVYDSLFGNTEKVAAVIAEILGPSAKMVQASAATLVDIENIDLLVVGCPTHGGRPSDNTKKFLASLPVDSLRNVKCAAFDTGLSAEGQKFFLKTVINILGYAAAHTARALQDRGGTIVAEPRVFYVSDKKGPLVSGELDRVVEWTKGILDKINL